MTQQDYFANNWALRNDLNPYWRRLYRFWARQNIAELRFESNRPHKRTNVSCAYGQQSAYPTN